MNVIVRRTSSILLASVVLPILIFSSAPATATPTFGVDYYVSPPLVQGTYVTTGLTQITFDTATINQPCPANLTPGGSSVTVTVSGICNVQAGGAYGGATRSDGTAGIGGTRSNYANVGSGTIGDVANNGATFSFSEPQVYLGVWWSAGSAQNRIRFYDGSNEVLELTTTDLFSSFGSAPTGDPLNTTSVLTAVNGSSYPKHQYFGHPFGHNANPPINRSSVTPGEPFVFLHVFGSGGLKFDSVKLDGGGFEFDNLVVSTSSQTVANTSPLVRIGGIAGTPATIPDPTGSGSLASTGSGMVDEFAGYIFGIVSVGLLTILLARRVRANS